MLIPRFLFKTIQKFKVRAIWQNLMPHHQIIIILQFSSGLERSCLSEPQEVEQRLRRPLEEFVEKGQLQ
jgi:hypothetical protein